MNILIYKNGTVYCPECQQTMLKHDFKTSETYCSNCGLVCIDTRLISPVQLKFFELEREKLGLVDAPILS